MLVSFSQTSPKLADDVKELSRRIQSHQDAKKRQYMDDVHPVKRATSTQHQPGHTSPSSGNDQNAHGDDIAGDGDITGAGQPEVFHGDALDETRVLSAFGKFMVRKIEARRNIFEASTCLVEAVYKNNSVLAQMFTDALMPLCSSATYGDLDFEALLADAIKRGCSLSIINNINQLWLKTQKKRNDKQLFAEYVRIMKASKVCRDDEDAERTVLYLCLCLRLLDITKIDYSLLKEYLPHVARKSLNGLQKYFKTNGEGINSQHYFDILSSSRPLYDDFF